MPFCYGYWEKAENIRGTLVRCRICVPPVRSGTLPLLCKRDSGGQSHKIRCLCLLDCDYSVTSAKNKRAGETRASRETHDASGAPKSNFRQSPGVAFPS